MKVAILQTDIQWASPEANRMRMENLMDRQQGADLYVLPEMCSTGFPAAKADEDTAGWMRQQACMRGAAIAGSIATQGDEGGRLRNRLLFAKPDGTAEHYDKRHLFSYGGEDKAYERGEKRTVVEWKGVRFLLQVCYDLRFPIWSRYRDDYDAILYVANWPTSRIAVWQTLLRARALENQCFVVGVNRVGSDPQCDYCGGSCIIDAYGQTLCACEDGAEGTAVAELDMERLRKFRRKFPVLDDRD